MQCFMKEIPQYCGNFAIYGKVAYVEQEPFIFPDSFKENVIFGRPYD